MSDDCPGCQAGVEHDCTGGSTPRRARLHPEDRRVCIDCQEVYNARSARLGSERCPRCDRRADRRAGR